MHKTMMDDKLRRKKLKKSGAGGEICTPEACATSYKDVPVVYLGTPALKMFRKSKKEEPKRQVVFLLKIFFAAV